MKKTILLFLTIFLLLVANKNAKSAPRQNQQTFSDTLPVRGFAIAAPRPTG